MGRETFHSSPVSEKFLENFTFFYWFSHISIFPCRFTALSHAVVDPQIYVSKVRKLKKVGKNSFWSVLTTAGGTTPDASDPHLEIARMASFLFEYCVAMKSSVNSLSVFHRVEAVNRPRTQGRSQRGHAPQNFQHTISSHFVLWEAVSQTKCCCSPKVKNFGLATPLHDFSCSCILEVDGLPNLLSLSKPFALNAFSVGAFSYCAKRRWSAWWE